MRICLAMLLWLWGGVPAVAQAAMPSISFDSIGRDAGRVPQGEAIQQVFAFTNKGTGALEIKSVEPS